VASTPVLSKTLLIFVAISLAVSPAVTVTFADPSCPEIVIVSD